MVFSCNLNNFKKMITLCDKIGVITMADLIRFADKELYDGENLISGLERYAKELEA